MAIEDQIINAESGGDPDAKNPNSTASGPGQFIDSTFLSVLKQHRPDLAQGQSDDALLALKHDPQLAAELTSAYAQDNKDALTKSGLPVTPGNLYLSHFAGPSGATKILQADADTPASDILGPAAVAANPFLRTMTAGGVRAWASQKVGTPPPQRGPQPQSAPPPNANALMNLLGQAPAGQGPRPNAAVPLPQAAPAAAAMQPLPFTGNPSQLAPIFAQRTQPHPVDLSALKAALAARGAPIFPGRGV